MSEKGGKGYSQPKGGKSALKSPSSLKGKDDGSAKSKRGRKVQFDPEDSLDAKVNSFSKSGGKGDNPFSKGNLGKGGKGEKIANGGKSLPPLELRLEQELPENAKCMMDCEAGDILQGIQDHMIVLSTDPTIKIPTSFDRALQYATRGNHYKNPQSVKRALETLKKHGVADGEMCMIANTAPESVDEVFALIPSFKGKKNKLREPLEIVLSELEKLKTLT